jgi:hypothetical protein
MSCLTAISSPWVLAVVRTAARCSVSRLDRIPVRDSKDPHGPVLVVSPAEWRMFLASLHR